MISFVSTVRSPERELTHSSHSGPASVGLSHSLAQVCRKLMSDSSSRTRRVAVFSDFDGTIAHPDTINLLAETFGGVEFRRDIGGKIASGEISLRDGIAAKGHHPGQPGSGPGFSQAAG